MSSPDRRQENDTIIDELLTLLSRDQIYMLIDLLGKLREAKHGEISLRVSGDRLFMSKKESLDAGHLVNPQIDR